MFWILYTIPLMLLAVAIATVPILKAMHQELSGPREALATRSATSYFYADEDSDRLAA